MMKITNSCDKITLSCFGEVDVAVNCAVHEVGIDGQYAAAAFGVAGGDVEMVDVDALAVVVVELDVGNHNVALHIVGTVA